MADEEKNTPDVAEFEAKLSAQTGNKDLWLFLINFCTDHARSYRDGRNGNGYAVRHTRTACGVG